jgi:predicted  nucleic acid-binding Zn-ribbon protein
VCNKAQELADLISDNDIDLFLITETWLSNSSDNNKIILGDLVPAGYKIVHVPRRKGRGGGVAIVYKESLNLDKVETIRDYYTSMELVEVLLKTGNDCIRLVVMYRPPPSGNSGQPTSVFLQEFSDYIDGLSTTSGQLLICGDLNFHFADSTNDDARKFMDLIFSLNLNQHVTVATHIHGHILDLVLTRANDFLDLVQNIDVHAAVLSDHSPISFQMPFRKPAPVQKEFTVRRLNNIDIDELHSDILNSKLVTSPPCDITEYVQLYNNTLSDILDSHAPSQTKKVTIKQQYPWFTEEIRNAKKQRRKAERQWRKTKLQVHLDIYKYECANVSRMCRKARSNYYCSMIEDCGNDQKKLFNIANELMNKKKDCTLPTSNPQQLSERFAEFFTEKIAKIKKSFDSITTVSEHVTNESSPPVLSTFLPTTDDEVRKIIMDGNSKTCHLDPLPTQLVKTSLDVLLPTLTKIVNHSLSSATVPTSLKSATVTPLLKKSSLNGEDMKNYRPVSNLPYLSKLIEKVVVKRLNTHMSTHHLHEYYQSAYRMYHSTESALLRVHSDVLQAVDKKQCVFLVLLDQSAAFDTVDHSILLGRLEDTIGVSGSALEWCRSYFADRSQSVHVLGVPSLPRPLTSGMPQGSVMGPFGFPPYSAPIGEICRRHDICYHFYADDSQLYLSFSPQDEDEARNRLEACIQDIREWMKQNHLKLNEAKTEFLVIGSHIQLQKLKIDEIKIGDTIVKASKSARNIGAIFDHTLSMKDHINTLCRSCYCHIRNIGKVRPLLTRDAAVSLMHAFVSSKLDHMNALLYGVPKYLLQKLQKIQNNGARIVSKTKRRQHITPVLKSLHWLPVEFRILYKIQLTTHKALNGRAPGYIRDLLQPYQPPRALRSMNLSFLKKPRVRTKTFGDKSYAVCAPYLWNKLPLSLRQCEELEPFKRGLKTHLFEKAFG